ncbi:MAG: hypothetical protein J0L92_11395 [Deltaproteobacteria bacterium]|nr:hypothetical protein [Deltaproteobacteria bacterium]
MNVVLWVLQVLLALHTLAGALWKLSNAEAQVPSLAALPHALWLALVPIELACALALVIPAVPSLRARLARAPSIAATVIAAEMLLFTGVSIASGHAVAGEIGYWVVVAALSGVIAGGRTSVSPLASHAV